MAFEELKAKQSVMWGSGPYQNISDHLTIAHDHLMRVFQPRAGERWLDLATGTGEIAVRAAQGGAEVTGLDLAPDLIESAKERASEAGVEVEFETGDAEAVPHDDASFDTVTSTFGVMFAPDHEAVAGELARVCKPGGRLGLLTWHPTEGVAAFFKVMAAYQPSPPPGLEARSSGAIGTTCSSCWEMRSTSRTKPATAPSRVSRPRRPGSCSRRRTGPPRRSRTPSMTTSARRCATTGSSISSSSARTTASVSRGPTCW